jgi:hypothetical protein
LASAPVVLVQMESVQTLVQTVSVQMASVLREMVLMVSV